MCRNLRSNNENANVEALLKRSCCWGVAAMSYDTIPSVHANCFYLVLLRYERIKLIEYVCQMGTGRKAGYVNPFVMMSIAL